jgi:hypothetical protein
MDHIAFEYAICLAALALEKLVDELVSSLLNAGTGSNWFAWLKTSVP